jgi:N-acetylglucosaminylphosphatidylinositol deacetylase
MILTQAGNSYNIHLNIFASATNDCRFRLPKSVRVFCLRSVNLLRKYSLLFDVPMSFLLGHTAYVASLSDWWTIQKAMACHNSQYVWFRKAYMIFSRYVVINTFDRMNTDNS